MRRPPAFELASGVLALPPLAALAGGVALAMQETPPSDIGLEVVRLVGTLLATGGVVWMVATKALTVWQAGREAERKQDQAMWESMQAEVAALREEQRQERGEERQRHREEILYYREMLTSERSRVDTCQARLATPPE